MKAISLWQPWASLIATGAKKIETRSWATNYRGPLAIHAAKTDNQELRSMMSFWQIQTGLAPLKGKKNILPELTWSGVCWEDLPRGCVIAICKLVDCIPTDNMTQKQIEIEQYFGDFTPGRFAWILEDIQPLPEPMPAKGKQGLWDWEYKKDYSQCIYWRNDKCLGFNCCTESECPHAPEYQPWLRERS